MTRSCWPTPSRRPSLPGQMPVAVLAPPCDPAWWLGLWHRDLWETSAHDSDCCCHLPCRLLGGLAQAGWPCFARKPQPRQKVRSGATSLVEIAHLPCQCGTDPVREGEPAPALYSVIGGTWLSSVCKMGLHCYCENK